MASAELIACPPGNQGGTEHLITSPTPAIQSPTRQHVQPGNQAARPQGIPVGRPKRRVRNKQSQHAVQELEAELAAKQQQLADLSKQNGHLCHRLQVLQQVVVYGQAALETLEHPRKSGSHNDQSTLNSSQQQLLADLEASPRLSQHQQVMQRLLGACDKETVQGTPLPGFLQLLQAAEHGRRLLQQRHRTAGSRAAFEEWAAAMLSMKRAFLTWNQEAFWGCFNTNLATLQPEVPRPEHWRAVVAQFQPTPHQVRIILDNHTYLQQAMWALTDKMHLLVRRVSRTLDFSTHYQLSQELTEVLRDYCANRLLYGMHFSEGLGPTEWGRFCALSWPHALSVSAVGAAMTELYGDTTALLSAGGSGASTGSCRAGQHLLGLRLDSDLGRSGNAACSGQPPFAAATAPGLGPAAMQPTAAAPGVVQLLTPSPAAAILERLMGPAADRLRRQLRLEEQVQWQQWQGQLQQLASVFLQLLVEQLQQRPELWGVCGSQEHQQQQVLQLMQTHGLPANLGQHQQQLQPCAAPVAAGAGPAAWWGQLGLPPLPPLQGQLQVVDPPLSATLQDLLCRCRAVLSWPQYAQLPGAAQVVGQLEQQFLLCLSRAHRQGPAQGASQVAAVTPVTLLPEGVAQQH